MWWFRANSTDRSASTFQPVAADLEHLLEGDLRYPVRCDNDTGIGGEHARDVGVDLAQVRLEGSRERDRSRV